MMKLEEFAEINMGQSPVSSSYNENEDGLPFFKVKQILEKLIQKLKCGVINPPK